MHWLDAERPDGVAVRLKQESINRHVIDMTQVAVAPAGAGQGSQRAPQVLVAPVIDTFAGASVLSRPRTRPRLSLSN